MADIQEDSDSENKTNLDESEFLTQKIQSELSKIYREIDAMGDIELEKKLNMYGLYYDSNTSLNRKRLKTFYEKFKHASKRLYISDNLLPYYVVVDFEATCEAFNPPNYKHEIIEFPAILVNSQSLKIEDTFHKYCRPSENPQLSEFCIELTGISQTEVDNAQTFSAVLSQFIDWLKSHKLGTTHKFALVFDGPYDICRFFYIQCLLSNLNIPGWAKKWVNIRKIFRAFYRHPKCSLLSMLDFLQMAFEGRHHSGLDDAKNIARVLMRLICDGAEIQINEAIRTDSIETHNQICMEAKSVDKLERLINNLNLEGEKVAVMNKKLLTFKDVKIQRAKAGKELAKAIAKESIDIKVTDDFESTGDNESTFSVHRTYVSKKKKKKKGKPRRN